jgi:hypothetical protein
MAAALATLLLLSLYARFKPAYAVAYDCYARALKVAGEAKLALDAGLPLSPPQGWEVLVVYANGTTLRYGSLVRERCMAYEVAEDGSLVVARG